MSKMFPVLESKIVEHGYRKKEIAQKIGVSERAFINKCNGDSDFKWEEVCTLQREFFPEVTKDTLMQRAL